jgi:hypothetical protein
MNVRMFPDAHDILYSDLPQRTAADVPPEDLSIVRTDTGLVFAVNLKTGDVFRNKKEWSEK